MSDKKAAGIGNALMLQIGLFVVAYANLEQLVHSVAYKYIGLPEDASRALIAGARFSDVMGLTKRLILAQKLDQQIYDDLDELFGQIAEISKFRDKLLHRQWGAGANGILVLVNRVSAKSTSSLEEDPISAADIHSKAMECAHLLPKLSAHILTREYWETLPSKNFDPEILKALRCPWFEKPQGPAVPPQLRHKGSR